MLSSVSTFITLAESNACKTVPVEKKRVCRRLHQKRGAGAPVPIGAGAGQGWKLLPRYAAVHMFVWPARISSLKLGRVTARAAACRNPAAAPAL